MLLQRHETAPQKRRLCLYVPVTKRKEIQMKRTELYEIIWAVSIRAPVDIITPEPVQQPLLEYFPLYQSGIFSLYINEIIFPTQATRKVLLVPIDYVWTQVQHEQQMK